MPGKIIIAPEYVDVEGPLIFLAGPIQGAPLWQESAMSQLDILAPNVHIASPRRRTEYNGEFTPAMYDEQVDWETFFLNRAANNGVVLVWCAKEAVHDCKRAYAQTTRAELFEWKVKHERDGINLALGIEARYTGAKYIRRRFSQDCPKIQIQPSLEKTCIEAVRQIYKV